MAKEYADEGQLTEEELEATSKPLAVQCPICRRLCRQKYMVDHPGGIRCKWCNEGFDDAEREVLVHSTLQDMVSIHLDSREDAEKNPLEKVETILKAAYEQLGGAHAVGTEMARALQKMMDEAEQDERSYKSVVDTYLKVISLHHKVQGAAPEDEFDDMSLEELQAAKRDTVMGVVQEIIKEESGKQLIKSVEKLVDQYTVGEAMDVLEANQPPAKPAKRRRKTKAG